MQPSLTRTTVFCMVSDLAMLAFLLFLSLILRNLFGGNIDLDLYFNLFCSLLLVLPIYAAFGLYPPVLLSSYTALKKISCATTVLFLIIFTLTFFFRSANDYSRLALLFAWFLALIFMPVWRGFIKRRFSNRKWWGNSIILCGSEKWIQEVVRHLYNEPAIGLKPCAAVFLDEQDSPVECESTKLIVDVGLEKITLPCYNLDNLPDFFENFNSPYAFMDLHSLDSGAQISMAKLGQHFKKAFFVFSFLGHLNCWSGISDLGGRLALETRQKLLDPRRQQIKRGIDLFLTLLGGIAFVPLTIIIWIIIKLEDGGPIFYAHSRIGKGGKSIRILKFRTMTPNADKVLKDYLAKDPLMAEEWAKTHKLRNDPRITKAGRWLRKTSLDELPQVWNVLKGELSFVGPRPIVEAEIEKYGEAGFALYTRVLPGLTGFWQISGRSNTSYAQRVELDSYYIRNWSVWLDIYIIACTPRALLDTSSAC